MGIRVLEIHHHAVRIDSQPPKLEAAQKFYRDVLGLEADPGRPKIPGVPGFWINVGEGGQIHLIGGEQPSPLPRDLDRTPRSLTSLSRLLTSRKPRQSLIG